MELKRLPKFRETGNFSWGNYQEMTKNSSFEDARIVVVAESHYERVKREKRILGVRFNWLEIHWSDSRERVRELLARQTASGDVMLRESHRLGKRFSWKRAHNEFGINRDVRVYGWDNMRLARRCRIFRGKARRAHLRGDTQSENYYDSQTRFYGDQRNQSMHQAIEMMEKCVKEGNTLYHVAGSAHVEDNEALFRLLANYKYVVLKAQSVEDVRRTTSFEPFP